MAKNTVCESEVDVTTTNTIRELTATDAVRNAETYAHFANAALLQC
jgi:hypothetical protein